MALLLVVSILVALNFKSGKAPAHAKSQHIKNLDQASGIIEG